MMLKLISDVGKITLQKLRFKFVETQNVVSHGLKLYLSLEQLCSIVFAPNVFVSFLHGYFPMLLGS
jgi:hypothetical protein